MKGFASNIEHDTLENDAFRKVLYTAPEMQLVVMALAPGEDIGSEVHDDGAQFIRCEAGEGVAVLNGVEHPMTDGVSVVIPGGVEHNVKNTSETETMRLYTLYSPPEHRDGVVHQSKAEAEADDEHYDGVPTEQ